MSYPSGPTPALPSVEELLALEYKSTPFSQGQTSDDYRQQHRDYGERIRCWKSFEEAGTARGPGGELPVKGDVLFIEQTIAEAVRVRIYNSKKTVVSPEFGLIAAGTAMISCLPDEIELARGDAIARIDRTFKRRCGLKPSGQSTDRLPYPLIAEIMAVIGSTGVLPASAYTVCPTGIEWTDEPPSERVLIEFRDHPVYFYDGETDNIPPMGSDDKLLPQIGSLKAYKPKDGFPALILP